MGEAAFDALNITGHTVHLSVPEWGRTIGEYPRYRDVTLPPGCERGFTDGPGGGSDCNALGHWSRDPGAKAEATAAEAAMAAGGEEARRAAARALGGGGAAPRGDMALYYGTGEGRQSERVKQMGVRQRLAHIIRAIIQREGDWRDITQEGGLRLIRPLLAGEE